jgi:hypothetical protein
MLPLLIASCILYATPILTEDYATESYEYDNWPAFKGPLVKTTSGPVRGFYPHSSVAAFYGIPFAQPPLGKLRFQAPLPVTSPSKSEIDGTTFGKSCFQVSTETIGQGAFGRMTGASEDCLTVNIWAPVKKSGKKKLKPVFIWIYGGGFAEGASSIPCMICTFLFKRLIVDKIAANSYPVYSGLELVKSYQDYLVVSFKYGCSMPLALRINFSLTTLVTA